MNIQVFVSVSNGSNSTQFRIQIPSQPNMQEGDQMKISQQINVEPLTEQVHSMTQLPGHVHSWDHGEKRKYWKMDPDRSSFSKNKKNRSEDDFLFGYGFEKFVISDDHIDQKNYVETENGTKRLKIN